MLHDILTPFSSVNICDSKITGSQPRFENSVKTPESLRIDQIITDGNTDK